MTKGEDGAARQAGFLCLCVASLLLGPSATAAQGPGPPHQSEWVRHTGIAAANVTVAGLTTAIAAWIRGEDAADAFVQGSVGGAGVFLGKRIATERFGGAGLLGRQLAAVGSSVAANGGMGRGWLDEVWLPIGPVWVQASPASAHDLRLDLSSAAAMAWAGTRPELRLDWGQSLSTGTAIFVAHHHRIARGPEQFNGVALPGVAILGVGNRDLSQVRAHEMVHVIQFDYLQAKVGRPVEAWAWRSAFDIRIPVDLGVGGLLMTPSALSDLTEAEAYGLAR